MDCVADSDRDAEMVCESDFVGGGSLGGMAFQEGCFGKLFLRVAFCGRLPGGCFLFYSPRYGMLLYGPAKEQDRDTEGKIWV